MEKLWRTELKNHIITSVKIGDTYMVKSYDKVNKVSENWTFTDGEEASWKHYDEACHWLVVEGR